MLSTLASVGQTIADWASAVADWLFTPASTDWIPDSLRNLLSVPDFIAPYKVIIVGFGVAVLVFLLVKWFLDTVF